MKNLGTGWGFVLAIYGLSQGVVALAAGKDRAMAASKASITASPGHTLTRSPPSTTAQERSLEAPGQYPEEAEEEQNAGKGAPMAPHLGRL